MSRVPDEIEGLGSVRRRLRQNPAFDVTAHALTSEDYFVWSRLDGYTSTREVILMTGFPVDRAISILIGLRRRGAVLLPGEVAASVTIEAEPPAARNAPEPPARGRQTSPPPARGRQTSPPPARGRQTSPPPARPGRPTRPPPGRRPGETRPPALDDREPPAAHPGPPEQPLGPLSPDEQRAMDQDVGLSDEDKRRVIAMRRKLGKVDYFALLGVDREAGKRELKRAYFRLSKAFHPDRYYGVETGAFGPWLSEIFETAGRAFEVLSDPKRRERYEAALTGKPARASSESGQSRAEYAAELFQRACEAETQGQTDDAVRLFAATIRMDPRARYLRRAATCATTAGALAEAERWARDAIALEPDNPSTVRILARALHAAGRLAEAERALVSALELPTDNDVLARELAADLAAVRAKLYL